MLLAMDKATQAREIVAEALQKAGPACFSCSFQTEDMIVLEFVREQVPDVPVLFLDTGYHFAEVYRYRDEMVKRYNLNLVDIVPQEAVEAQEAKFGQLYRSRPDECCRLRKVGPLFVALEQYEIWFTGLRRVQSPTRANLQPLELFPLPSGKQLLKVSPLATWTDEEVWQFAGKRGMPVLALYDEGYTSIGCAPCTTRPTDASNPRSGRWAGRKLECGIHIVETH